MACIVPQANSQNMVDIKIPCDDTKFVIDTLKNDYKEMIVAFGKTHDNAGSTMSIWVNPTTKSWTILATLKDVTCIIGVGDNFDFAPTGRFKS